MIITGGAGFIGANAARYFSGLGWRVTVLDNLSRRGAGENLRWLQELAPVAFTRADIRDADALNRIVADTRPDVLLHLAGQVAVTTSVVNPREDFDINALGTFNVLEALRLGSPDTFMLNASTNKVYGKMADVEITERNGRYEYRDLVAGCGEDQPLDFHSPYGCSKGVADQYVLDYARIYGLATTSFRQSCIYGTRQFGIEDQGWVAWFTIAHLLDKPITVYGDGKQIRDVLYVDDLCRAYEAAIHHRAVAAGEAFNIGGGPQNTLSLLELLHFLDDFLGGRPAIEWGDWRPGDQPVFVCNLEKAGKMLNWYPETGVKQGVADLAGWVKRNPELFDWLR